MKLHTEDPKRKREALNSVFNCIFLTENKSRNFLKQTRQSPSSIIYAIVKDRGIIMNNGSLRVVIDL